MDLKEAFDIYKGLTKARCLISGFGEIIKKEGNFIFETKDIFIIGGCFDEGLISDSFDNEFICNVEKEGCYTFEAMLFYQKEQRGDYPPPNLECEQYMDVEHIEYVFLSTIEEKREMERKIEEDSKNDILKLPF